MLDLYRERLHASRKDSIRTWVNRQFHSPQFQATFMLNPGNGERGGLMVKWLMMFPKAVNANISANHEHHDPYYLADDAIWYIIEGQRKYMSATVWYNMDWLQLKANISPMDRNFHTISEEVSGYMVQLCRMRSCRITGLVSTEEAMLWLGNADKDPNPAEYWIYLSWKYTQMPPESRTSGYRSR